MKNQIVIQLWEESEKGWGVRPNGCTLHTNMIECRKYIVRIYNERDSKVEVPNEYDKICGEPLYAQVDDNLYNRVHKDINVIIPQYALSNLLRLDSIIYKETTSND